jgi:hypothetical protein
VGRVRDFWIIADAAAEPALPLKVRERSKEKPDLRLERQLGGWAWVGAAVSSGDVQVAQWSREQQRSEPSEASTGASGRIGAAASVLAGSAGPC